MARRTILLENTATLGWGVLPPRQPNRASLAISLLALLPLAGCFDSARVDELSCTKDKFCPDGYFCAVPQAGSPGKCQKRTDAGVPDGILVVDGATGSDAQTSLDSRMDGLFPATDVSVPGLDAMTDQGWTSDSPVGPDTSLDAGLGLEPDLPVSQVDMADGSTAGPDLGSGRDAAADLGPNAGPETSPDIPYGPETGPDVPLTSCVIGGTSYANGAANPANACQVCKLANSPSSWSNADEGTSCDSGRFCNQGSCKAGCFISGAYYANDAANPANGCQTCQTGYALTSWTTRSNGASCGTGQVCNGGTCQSGCWIDGALVGSGATNSSNVCQICKPATSTSGWSNNNDGTGCGGGKICSAGSCQSGCYIGSAVYATGALNPANGCQSCNPATSTSSWYQVPSDCATIAAHSNFTCATISGVAKCWGTNTDGVLGQSYAQLDKSPVPLTISTLGTDVQALSTGGGSSHSCALVGGGIKCWGRNDFGQLGNGVTGSSYTPVQVNGLGAGGMGIASGETHSCALQNGGVECWGTNTNGQLGSASSQGVSPPVAIALGGSAQAITSGASHSCALVSGVVWCWGYNSNGQLGNNSTTDSSIPVQVAGLGSNVQAIAAGQAHTCAITNGSLLCWGHNSDGEVGDGTTTDRWTPVPVQGLSSGVQAVAAGTYHTCAIVNGGAWCWGMNLDGELGNNSTTSSPSPVAVQGLASGVQAITAGYSHSCALTNVGVKCWGSNSYGELGNNSTTSSPIPVPVQGL
jgi:alpha-tubulin suppressor-like RCC1 family protein